MSLLEDCYAAYLNLDHRTDRAEHMERVLLGAGIAADRHKGGMVPWQYVMDRSRLQKMIDVTPPTIGCWFGQVGIMQEALRRNRHAFVMEDDLVFCSDFAQRLGIIEEFLARSRWDVFWLGGTYHAEVKWHPELGRDWQPTSEPRIVQTYGIWSTYAYIVNREAIMKILSLLDDDMQDSVGIDTSFIHLQPQLLTYAFVPGMVKQRDDRSDITGTVSRFSEFASLGPHWWQDKMSDFDPTR